MSSAVRTLPSTTAALRLSPRSFARFIGEPLNARLHSSCVMARISRASDLASRPASASRSVNAGSRSSLAKRTFHGHTSWDLCRLTRFEIPLGTGARTLRAREVRIACGGSGERARWRKDRAPTPAGMLSGGPVVHRPIEAAQRHREFTRCVRGERCLTRRGRHV